MKATHRPDIFTFSVFDESRDLDFNGYFLRREGGNVLVDPVPLSAHDRAHIERLGGVASIVITNSDHVRDARVLADAFGAKLLGPAAEREGFPVACDQVLRAGDEPFPGCEIIELEGSKTPGELALVVDGDTLVVGDLVRGHVGGALNLLPAAKLSDPAAALRSVRALASRPEIEAVLVGDGWPVFRDGHARLEALLESATQA